MNQTLREYANSRGVAVRVDRTRGVIRGVKILGLVSRNGRTYGPESVARAARLYEGAKVNVNHPEGRPTGPRDYRDRIGVIRGVEFRPEQGLFADFHYNPRHALAEQLAWDAEHSPENVGFSHNVQVRTSRRDDQLLVDEILRVHSVDLVADPATTSGLFEAETADSDTEDSNNEVPTGDGNQPIEPTTESEDRSDRWPPSLDDLQRDYPAVVEALRADDAARIESLEADVRRLTEERWALQRKLLVSRLLHESGLPDLDSKDPADPSVFDAALREAIDRAESEQAIRTLIEDRARLLRAAGERRSSRPQSREQRPLAVDEDRPVDFVNAIT